LPKHLSVQSAVIIIIENFENTLFIYRDSSEQEWLIIDTNFAPNVSEQNPVEDIWFPSQKFCRKFDYLC
jgi:hypothetical protein